jgi:hypothetical protein
VITGLGRLLCVFGVILLISMSISGCGQSNEKTIASVGATKIGASSVNHWAEIIRAAQDGAVPAPPLAGQQALSLLLSWARILREAERLGVSVSDNEASRQLAEIDGSGAGSVERRLLPWEGGLAPYLNDAAASHPDEVHLVRLDMLSERIDDRLVALAASSVRHASIAAYYRQHKHEFYVSERRDIKAVMNWSKAAVLEAKHEMQRGIKFSVVAERFNQSIEGGLRLGRAPGTQTKRYEKDYFAAPLHVLVGPVKELMYYVFEVFHAVPGYQRTLQTVTPTIRQRLAEGVARVNRTHAEEMLRVQTTCLIGYVTSSCGRTVKAFS